MSQIVYFGKRTRNRPFCYNCKTRRAIAQVSSKFYCAYCIRGL